MSRAMQAFCIFLGMILMFTTRINTAFLTRHRMKSDNLRLF